MEMAIRDAEIVRILSAIKFQFPMGMAIHRLHDYWVHRRVSIPYGNGNTAYYTHPAGSG